MADMTKEQAIEILNRDDKEMRAGYFCINDFVAIKTLKEFAQTVKERKQGKWCKQNDDYFDWYECSECGYGSEGEMQYSREHDVRTNFCPCCGADMRGNENA